MSRRGASARAPIGASIAGPSRPVKLGPLAYSGPDGIVCPECRVRLDPGTLKPGEVLPKHGRHGQRAWGQKTPPCRGWVVQLKPEGGE